MNGPQGFTLPLSTAAFWAGMGPAATVRLGAARPGFSVSLTYLMAVRLYSIMSTIGLLTRSGTGTQRETGTDYTAVPVDFPHQTDATFLNRCLDWNVCEELALHLAGECARLLVEADRSVRPVDILLKSYRVVESLGWGDPPLLRRVVRRVASLLNWPAPDIARPL